jgi:HEAT repeat protein
LCTFFVALLAALKGETDMADRSPLDILAAPPSFVDLSATHDFQSAEVGGVSCAVDPEARTRIAAAAEAARLRIADAIPFLVAMLSQDRTSVASADLVIALKASDSTVGPSRKAENLDRFAQADQACQAAAAAALAAMGATALPALKNALMARNPNRRLGAARALGQMGREAEPALGTLADLAKVDPVEAVRLAATEASKQIKPRKWF